MTCPCCGEECELIENDTTAECANCQWRCDVDPFVNGEGCLFDSLEDEWR